MGSRAASVECRVYGGEAVDNFFGEKSCKVRENLVPLSAGNQAKKV